MGSPIFEAHHEDVADRATLKLVGELDIETVPILAESLAAIAPTASLVIDLSELAFMDSSGLSALLRAWKEADAAGRAFSLVGVTDPVRRLLKVTGTEFLAAADARTSVA